MGLVFLSQELQDLITDYVIGEDVLVLEPSLYKSVEVIGKLPCGFMRTNRAIHNTVQARWRAKACFRVSGHGICCIHSLRSLQRHASLWSSIRTLDIRVLGDEDPGTNSMFGGIGFSLAYYLHYQLAPLVRTVEMLPGLEQFALVLQLHSGEGGITLLRSIVARCSEITILSDFTAPSRDRWHRACMTHCQFSLRSGNCENNVGRLTLVAMEGPSPGIELGNVFNTSSEALTKRLCI